MVTDKSDPNDIIDLGVVSVETKGAATGMDDTHLGRFLAPGLAID